MAGLEEIGIFGGSGFYSLLDDVRGPRSTRRTARRRTPSSSRRSAGGGRVPAPPRPPPHVPPHKVNYRANVWAMRSLGVKPYLAVRRGLAAAPRGARPLRRLGPVRGPHDRPRRHVLRRADRVPRQLGRDLRPDAPRDRARRHPRARDHGPRRRDGRRHPGPAVLDEGRVEVVHGRGLGGHQHDPVPRGVPLPGAGHGRREHRAHHRLRRGRARGHRGGDRARRLEVFEQNAERIRAVVLDMVGRFPADLDASVRASRCATPAATGTRRPRRHPDLRDRPCRWHQRSDPDAAPSSPPTIRGAAPRLRQVWRAHPDVGGDVRAVQPAGPQAAVGVAGARDGVRGDRGRRRRARGHRDGSRSAASGRSRARSRASRPPRPASRSRSRSPTPARPPARRPAASTTRRSGDRTEAAYVTSPIIEPGETVTFSAVVASLGTTVSR